MHGVAEGLLWTPGNGLTSRAERQAANAVQEYESDLILGQRQDTREWVVYLRNGPMSDGQPFPIFNLGTELPTADKIKEKLYKADLRRHGKKIFQQIMQANDRATEAGRKAADEASAEMAEALVSGFKHQGFDPYPKSLPNQHPKNRQYRKAD